MIAFLLAGIGIHGLLAFTVSQRLREIGVRVAAAVALSVAMALLGSLLPALRADPMTVIRAE